MKNSGKFLTKKENVTVELDVISLEITLSSFHWLNY